MLVDYIMENKRKFRPAPGIKLMDQVRQVLHYHHYAYQTEKTYCSWIEQYVRFHKCNKHPREMGKVEIESFLSHLATNRSVSASTQPLSIRATRKPLRTPSPTIRAWYSQRLWVIPALRCWICQPSPKWRMMLVCR